MLTSENVQDPFWSAKKPCGKDGPEKALLERHNIIHQKREMTIKAGEVVLVESEEHNRGKWKLGVVDIPIDGSDGVVRAVQLWSVKSFIERPIQCSYPLELACNVSTQREVISLNAEAKEFRPSRQAAVSARR